MHLVSYAQNQEDIMLWRALKGVTEGCYIDIGAADPVEYSVTRVFYDRGWHGINVEPDATYFGALCKARPRDINLSLAAGRKAGQLVFHDIDGTGLSTFDSAIAEQHRANGWAVTEQTVEVWPLADICRRYRGEGPIHFLKVDVEGGEADVLAGADFTTFRPWIVLVEATLPGTQVVSYEAWEPFLTRNGYSFVWFDGLNRFYLSDEMKPSLEQYFRVPPNIFDGFESAASLLVRAEHAELHAAETAQALQEKCTALDVANTALGAANAAEQEAKQHVAKTALALHEKCAALDVFRQRNQFVEAQIAALLSSTSWRVTAPLRMVRRLLSGKELARQIFYRGMQQLLRAPGSRCLSRCVSVIAPRPREWLALHYRAYALRYRACEQQDTTKSPQIVVPESTPRPASTAPFHMSGPNLSEEEAQLIRQFVALGIAHPAEAATTRGLSDSL